MSTSINSIKVNRRLWRRDSKRLCRSGVHFLRALKGRDSKAQGENPGSGRQQLHEPCKGETECKDMRHPEIRSTFCAALSGLFAWGQCPRVPLRSTLGFSAAPFQGFNPLPPSWGLLDTTRSAGGVFIAYSRTLLKAKQLRRKAGRPGSRCPPLVVAVFSSPNGTESGIGTGAIMG
jgi:hypothetical protein